MGKVLLGNADTGQGLPTFSSVSESGVVISLSWSPRISQTACGNSWVWKIKYKITTEKKYPQNNLLIVTWFQSLNIIHLNWASADMFCNEAARCSGRRCLSRPHWGIPTVVRFIWGHEKWDWEGSRGKEKGRGAGRERREEASQERVEGEGESEGEWEWEREEKKSKKRGGAKEKGVGGGESKQSFYSKAGFYMAVAR